jgi:hypothetical protein
MAALDAKTALKAAESGGGMYCYLDLDVAGDRERLSRCAAFVDACDTRYGFASSDLLALGGSELKRIPGMFELDHEWGSKGPIATLPPPCGCRVVVELFPAASPLACENFYRLCMGREAGVGACGKPLAYRGSSVHRVQTGFVIQGGDFVMGNGSGGESVYGTKGGRFKDDRGGLALKHDSAAVRWEARRLRARGQRAAGAAARGESRGLRGRRPHSARGSDGVRGLAAGEAAGRRLLAGRARRRQPHRQHAALRRPPARWRRGAVARRGRAIRRGRQSGLRLGEEWLVVVVVVVVVGGRRWGRPRPCRVHGCGDRRWRRRWRRGRRSSRGQ